jgi:hypothetical protein
MHQYKLLMFFALLILAFGLFSRIAERKSVTGSLLHMENDLGFYAGIYWVSLDSGIKGTVICSAVEISLPSRAACR